MNISFAQHIRTSSKARRGFRTFKRTTEIEAFDEKLGAYGVYSATQYDNFQDMAPEDYPKLFMFYRLENYTVVCRSSYEGTDLHSYPPRSGNYLAHSLLCPSKERFNPLQVWLANIWKTKQDIEKEDSSEGVGLEIERLVLNLDGDLGYTQDLQELLSKDSPRRDERALMFTQIVDAIIQRKKVLIVDETKYLEKWAFSLIQVFPEEFVFRYVSIASFATSNALTEICNVLCFEPQNAEKARRYENEQVIVVDINTVKVCQVSSYSKVLLESIMSEDVNAFMTFRKQVFHEFSVNSSYTLEEFVRNARFFDELYRMHEKNDRQFSEFVYNYTQDKQKVDAIFQEMKNQELWDEFILFWRALRTVKPTNNFEHYKEIHRYSIRGLTDGQWIEFEKEVVSNIDFSNQLNTLYHYFHLTEIESLARMEVYFLKIEAILSKIDENAQPDLIKFVKQFFKPLSDVHLYKLEEIEMYLDVHEKIQKAQSQEQQIFLLVDKSNVIRTFEQKNKIATLIKEFTWKEIFYLIKNNRHQGVIKLYDLNYNIQLPNKQLALYIAKNEKNNLDGVQLYAFYSCLQDSGKIDFITHSTQKIKQIIIERESLRKVSDLERYLSAYREMLGEEIILEKFRKDYDSIREIWHLLEIFDDQIKFSTQYQAISKIKENNRLIFNKIINIDKSPIPPEFEKIAERLTRKGQIKRKTPKTTIEYSYNDLVSIGTISEFKDIYKRIDGKLFQEDMIKLVKPPWEYFVWRELHRHLKKPHQAEVPNLINNVLNYYSEKHPNLYKKWCYIACEYIIFCIIDNNMEMFRIALGQFNIDWSEYDFICNRLLCILTENNEVSEYFYKHEKYRSFGEGPTWI